jgi:hypothetical protein
MRPMHAIGVHRSILQIYKYNLTIEILKKYSLFITIDWSLMVVIRPIGYSRSNK